jgi:Na+-transporting methylmalonyl-CoA/oxaloacetate decarboxylase gamma subunit
MTRSEWIQLGAVVLILCALVYLFSCMGELGRAI